MREPYREILVVDLLGGIGDLIMLLPVVHGLARRNPGASLRVLTHEPGAALLRGDPAVAEVCTPGAGADAAREAVAEALAARRPDLAITTTRYDGIPDLLAASGARCVTDLWRHPPADEPVGERYLRILAAEGLLRPCDLGARPRVRLTPAEIAYGERTLARILGAAGYAAARPPVVLVMDAGMAVKRWPGRNWSTLAALLARLGHPLIALDAPAKHVTASLEATPHGGPETGSLGAGSHEAESAGIESTGIGSTEAGGADSPAPGWSRTARGGPAVAVLPRCDLRALAACFAAVARRGGVVVGGDTGPLRLAAAAGAATVGLFGPTWARRYGIGGPDAADLQGLPDCPHRRPTAITEQPCWWSAACPLSASGPACMADIPIVSVAAAIVRACGPSPVEAGAGEA